MRIHPLFLALSLSTLAPACARPTASTVAAASAPPKAPHPLYRLDFVLTADGTPAPQTFSYVVEDNGGSGELHAGRNIALGTGGRQDTGLKVRSHARGQGDNVLLDVDFELSDAETGGTSNIRKLQSSCKALVALGKQATIFRLDENKAHYDLSVTATKMQ